MDPKEYDKLYLDFITEHKLDPDSPWPPKAERQWAELLAKSFSK